MLLGLKLRPGLTDPDSLAVVDFSDDIGDSDLRRGGMLGWVSSSLISRGPLVACVPDLSTVSSGFPSLSTVLTRLPRASVLGPGGEHGPAITGSFVIGTSSSSLLLLAS